MKRLPKWVLYMPCKAGVENALSIVAREKANRGDAAHVDAASGSVYPTSYISDSFTTWDEGSLLRMCVRTSSRRGKRESEGWRALRASPPDLLPPARGRANALQIPTEA
jgi:hypothetical protein